MEIGMELHCAVAKGKTMGDTSHSSCKKNIFGLLSSLVLELEVLEMLNKKWRVKQGQESSRERSGYWWNEASWKE